MIKRDHYVTTLHYWCSCSQWQVNMIWYDSSSNGQGQGCPQYLALIVISDITDSSSIYSTMCWIPASVGGAIWIYHMRVRGIYWWVNDKLQYWLIWGIVSLIVCKTNSKQCLMRISFSRVLLYKGLLQNSFRILPRLF